MHLDRRKPLSFELLQLYRKRFMHSVKRNSFWPRFLQQVCRQWQSGVGVHKSNESCVMTVTELKKKTSRHKDVWTCVQMWGTHQKLLRWCDTNVPAYWKVVTETTHQTVGEYTFFPRNQSWYRGSPVSIFRMIWLCLKRWSLTGHPFIALFLHWISAATFWLGE